MITNFNLHLVSDSTGETVSSVARSALARFENVEAEEYIWSLVRTRGQMDRVIENIKENPGFVMFTLTDKRLRNQLISACEEHNVPYHGVLQRAVSDLSSFLGVESSVKTPGRQHELDEDYFSRIDAINFAISHDDGQSTWDLDEADIILIGVSRTSKSPTCVYLAYRGYRVANIPYVKGVPLPDIVEELKNPLIVGVTISPERLLQIRKNRLLSLDANEDTSYVDIEYVKEEILEVKKLCLSKGWPIVDVTRRSVEETAAAIIQKYLDRDSNKK